MTHAPSNVLILEFMENRSSGDRLKNGGFFHRSGWLVLGLAVERERADDQSFGSY